MLSDEALLRRAEAEIPRVYNPPWGGLVYVIADPPGAWIEPEPPEGRHFLDGPHPFFVSREDGSVVRFARRARVRAQEALDEWLSGGAVGAVALFVHPPPEVPQALREAWARAWLVTVPRYAMLRVPTAAELLAQLPMLASLHGK